MDFDIGRHPVQPTPNPSQEGNRIQVRVLKAEKSNGAPLLGEAVKELKPGGQCRSRRSATLHFPKKRE